ncbi:Homeodomain-like domain-containing protein [Burkholderia sp. WP9]|nr:Homeodomain-like domain-containing protein [Burkholderia sp. WP9]
MTVRQVERLVIRYQESGAAGLASRRRGRSGNRKLDEGLAQRALAIIRERYADLGPTLACEKLWEYHGIRMAKETVRQLMTDAGLWIPRRQRPPKIYQPRARRSCVGELVQIDGSEHPWFEERAPACTLLGVHRRCDWQADDAAFYGNGIDLQLSRGPVEVSDGTRQTCRVL